MKVSIICTTYNQSEYISDAIESFLMQKTNFEYEILIHDDASTDGTAEIIKEYVKKYKDIIKPIYQKENKYSQGIKVGYEYNIKRAKGKYIAICEGDDYWTDPYKLQKQVDYMENNPDCSLCVHMVKKIDSRSNKFIGQIAPYKNSQKFSVKDIIIGGGGFIGTNSILYPKKLFDNPPEWYLNSVVGDYPLQIYLASKGTPYYMEDNMSVYRVNAKGSWSENMAKGGNEQAIKLYKSLNTLLDDINLSTEKKYNDFINEAKRRNDFKILILEDKLKIARGDLYRDLYNDITIKEKIKILIKKGYYLLKSIL